MMRCVFESRNNGKYKLLTIEGGRKPIHIRLGDEEEMKVVEKKLADAGLEIDPEARLYEGKIAFEFDAILIESEESFPAGSDPDGSSDGQASGDVSTTGEGDADDEE